MPAWARLLAAGSTGGGIVIAGLIALAAWREGGPGFWPALWQFVATAAFWERALQFWSLSLLALVLTRVGSRALPPVGAALVAGGLVAFGQSAYLMGQYRLEPGPALAEAVLVALCYAAGSAVASRLYERL